MSKTWKIKKVTRSKLLPTRRALMGGAVWLASVAPALAKKKKASPIPPGRAGRVISGQSFTLLDGRTIRLGGVDTPRMKYKDIRAEPLAREARDVLKRLVTGQVLRFADPAPDKFSRLKAQVFAQSSVTDDPVWIQGEMIAQGYARVHTWRDDVARAADMLVLEKNAREAGRGIWAEEYYAVRTPNTIAASVGSFQIVQGRIVDAAIVRKRVYLNFGADWRNDFTISIAPKDVKRFARAGIVLAGLSGAKVRARGLIRSQNGPILYLDHPQALEILPD